MRGGCESGIAAVGSNAVMKCARQGEVPMRNEALCQKPKLVENTAMRTLRLHRPLFNPTQMIPHGQFFDHDPFSI